MAEGFTSNAAVQAFIRGMARGFKYADDCEHCGGKKSIRQTNGCSAPKRCPVCRGTGKTPTRVDA